jgi:hypothetical protein
MLANTVLHVAAPWLGQKPPLPQAAMCACLKLAQEAEDNGTLAELAGLAQTAWLAALAPTPARPARWPNAKPLDAATLADVLVTAIKKVAVEQRKRVCAGQPLFTWQQCATALRRYALLAQAAEDFGILPEIRTTIAKRWTSDLAHERRRLKEQARLAAACARSVAAIATRDRARDRRRRPQRRAVGRTARASGRKRHRQSSDDPGGTGRSLGGGANFLGRIDQAIRNRPPAALHDLRFDEGGAP